MPRLIAGTSVGTEAAIVLLAVGATLYYACIAEISLRDVDHGLIEAVKALDDVAVIQVSLSYLVMSGGDPTTALLTDGTATRTTH